MGIGNDSNEELLKSLLTTHDGNIDKVVNLLS